MLQMHSFNDLKSIDLYVEEMVNNILELSEKINSNLKMCQK